MVLTLYLYLEGSAAGCLALLLFVLGTSTTQDLEEVCRSLSHSRVDVCFRCFDMVVEVVAECLDVRDDMFHALGRKVAGEEDYLMLAGWPLEHLGGFHTECDIANLAARSVLDARNTLELQRRVVAEEDMRSILDCPSASIHKLLDEYLSVDSIGFLAENCTENNNNLVVASLDVDGLLLAIMNGHDFTTVLKILRRLFCCEFRSLFLQLVVFLVCLLERRGHRIALKEGELER